MRLINGSSFFLPELPRFFDDFKTRNWHNGDSGNHTSSTNTTIPAVNIVENNEGYVVEMAIPGMNKKDFNIQLEDNLLTISSEHKDETPMNEGDRWLHKEFSYQSFNRIFRLNHKVVDDMKINATYENGLLRLSIPKKEEAKAKPPKLITVS